MTLGPCALSGAPLSNAYSGWEAPLSKGLEIGAWLKAGVVLCNPDRLLLGVSLCELRSEHQKVLSCQLYRLTKQGLQ